MKAIAIKLMGFLFLVSLFFPGCQKEKVKVGLLMDNVSGERWQKDCDYIIKEVQNLKGEVIVKVADHDANKQLAQAAELMVEGADVLIVIAVNQFTAADIVKTAHDRGVKVISYDRLIKNCKVDYYVSTDHTKVGELQAEYLTKVKPKGKYAIIGGSIYDNNSEFLYLGQTNILQPFVDKGDIEIVYNQFTENWAEEEGYEHVMKCLEKSTELDAVIAGNDALAFGVIRALKEKGLAGKVLVSGLDAELRNIHEILMGNQTMTVYKPLQSLAAITAELAMKLAKEKPVERMYTTVSNGERLVPSVLLDPVVVNKENLKLTVISEGFQKEEDIYNHTVINNENDDKKKRKNSM